jgi:hypothetical protein
MVVTSNNPTDYINSFPEETKLELARLDKMITSAMPKTSRVMWEGKFWGGSEQKIIGYGDLTYVGSSKKEVKWFVIGLAKQKDYITVFVNAVQKGVYLAEKYKEEIGKAKVGKSSIGFKKIADIDFDKLTEIVKEAAALS